MKLDLHTHFYTEAFFQTIRDLPSEFSFGTSSSGQTIITYRGARFFGVTPAMTDVSKRLEDMDRVGIDIEVVSLSTPNVFFTDAEHQPEVAKMMNDSYADLIARHPKRFKGFASIPMDAPDAALVVPANQSRNNADAPLANRAQFAYHARGNAVYLFDGEAAMTGD